MTNKIFNFFTKKPQTQNPKTYDEIINSYPHHEQLRIKYLDHYDKNYSSLKDIDNSLNFIAAATENNHDDIGNEISSLLKIINKEIQFLQDENENHYLDLKDFGDEE